MREIKFRGKPIEDYGDVKWFYGSAVLDFEDKLAYIDAPGQGPVPVEWDSVGQFTGLIDKNGKPIIEGDLLEDYQGFDECYIMQVYFNQDEAAFRVRDIYTKEDLAFWDIDIDNCKIIGNIHDVPAAIADDETFQSVEFVR